MPDSTKSQFTPERASPKDRSHNAETKADEKLNESADKAATRAQETIKRYEKEHNIFTK